MFVTKGLLKIEAIVVLMTILSNKFICFLQFETTGFS